ncbi:amidohydrolase [Pigmentiphaga soli]|uniref:Amidohydrolase n=1 Tax=Pigmentiphaga soli TaxID=1007095 RepID=A0ABP8GDV4_9BURK
MRIPDIPPPVARAKAPEAAFPPLATDCHAHIFGPQDRYPLLPATHFVPHENPLPDYAAMLRRIGCERAVLVQPSVYATDNRLIEEALRQPPEGIALRGVAVVAADIDDREIERLHALGFRGIRINTASATRGLALADARSLAQRIKGLGWHLQFFVNLREQPQIEEALAQLPCPVVIDHFAKIRTSEGLSSPAFQALLRLLRRDNCYAKLMGPYFISDRAPGYPDIVPFARAMVEAAPDRVLWGTDWPHPSAREQMPDDGVLADLLLEWAGSRAQRDRMLVDNPQRLYGF